MEFTRRIETKLGYDEAIEAVTSALSEQGFGILTQIDMKATLKSKIDVDIEPTIILGACNPQLANRAYGADARIATLLPCNVVVRSEGGTTVIEAQEPRLIATIPENPALEPIADEASERIGAALDAVAGK
ncbi:MAG: DUF302 domain-containing protein [Acidimicrobiia bacterium]